jgi:predicted metal-dependent hydrolase
MNALSTTFPAGEAFFVRSVKRFRERVKDPALLEQIRAFSGQEGVHSREHERHVALLTAQGYGGIAKMNRQADRELRFWNRVAPRFALATTAALEHLTAILARQALSEPDEWAGAMHPDMAPLWQWHAMEEAEHKAVAFDVLRKVSGSHGLRVAAMLFASFGLLMDNLVRFAYFTAKDGNLLTWRIWRDAWRFVWGRDGMYRRLIPDYLRWYRRDFHPSQQDDQPLIEAHLTRMAS